MIDTLQHVCLSQQGALQKCEETKAEDTGIAEIG